MKVCQSVIVTLQIGCNEMDMELPTLLPIAELNIRILETLRVLFPQRYNEWKAITLCYNGGILEPMQTLASLGIWDGSFLQGEKVYH